MVTGMRSTVVISAGRSASTGRAQSFRILRRAAEMVRFGWRAYWRWRYRHMTLHLLRSLDQRLLRDIGVHPLSLQSALANGQPRSTNLFGACGSE
jgi:uncharacterized protein YjiS (DUF1127 family)